VSQVKTTKLERLHTLTAEAFLLAVKGTPLTDPNGTAILDPEGKVIYVPPTAAMMGKIIEFLKDNGVDSEPMDGTPVDSVVKTLKQFDGEPLYLEETGAETLPEIE
jgi:hypothetical protein